MGARSVVLQALARTAILLVCALVGWGALLVASALAAEPLPSAAIQVRWRDSQRWASWTSVMSATNAGPT